ncbi:uncharacterized protein LOC117335683 [Pecten maximus]|uniref:uncharacterized protein LOC117335683 n=1 Tax=Pecten maximus TaxID=6579 RepID=UPI001458EDE5|nr:uncharacterized protein LOC117335683 [Pecten maximus]
MSIQMVSSIIFVLTLMLMMTSVTSQKSCPEKFFDNLDNNADGYVDIEEFKICFSETGKKNIHKDEFLNATKEQVFDTCGVDPSFVFKTLANKKGVMHLENIFHADYDTDDDEKISLSEFQTEHYKIFVKWMSQRPLLLGFKSIL